jgi:hypothetical protein
VAYDSMMNGRFIFLVFGVIELLEDDTICAAKTTAHCNEKFTLFLLLPIPPHSTMFRVITYDRLEKENEHR